MSGRTYLRAATGQTWIYVSYWNTTASKRYIDEVDAYNILAPQGTMERITHTHSNYASPPTCVGNTCYRATPHSVPDRYGKRVLFASDWMRACGTGCVGSRDTTQAYVVGPYR